MINLASIGRFGRKVLGKERAEKEAKIKRVAANRFGKKVTGVDPAAVLTQLSATSPPPQPTKSTGNTAPSEQGEGDQATGQLHARFTVSADSPSLATGNDEDKGDQAGDQGDAGHGAAGGSVVTKTDLGKLTINQLAAILQANPRLLDGALEIELAREGGPRKGALVAMATIEEGQPSPRQEVLDRLRAEVAKLG